MTKDYDIQNYINTLSYEMGFSKVGWITISKNNITNFENWINKNYHGEMEYLKNSLEFRDTPSYILPTAKSMMVFSYNYHQGTDSTNQNISSYAQGRDYHKYLRKKLKKIGDAINKKFNLNADFRPCVDSAPLLERDLAVQAGLGWIGKNSLVISKEGSYYFLGILLSSLSCPDNKPIPIKNYCGTCNKCIKSCPTNAIVDNAIVDARKCISYLTIEYKGIIPVKLRKAMGTKIFGCDICQNCCPWNKKQLVTEDQIFSPRDYTDNNLNDLYLWDETIFLKNTEGSPIRRTGYECFKRNIAIALGNSKPKKPQIITNLLKDSLGLSSFLDEHINWALKELTKL